LAGTSFESNDLIATNAVPWKMSTIGPATNNNVISRNQSGTRVRMSVSFTQIEHEFRGRERVNERGQSFAQTSDSSYQPVVEFEPFDQHAQRESYAWWQHKQKAERTSIPVIRERCVFRPLDLPTRLHIK